MSGHIFFKDRWFGFDDGIYSACRLLEILSAYPNMHVLLKTLPKAPISTPEIKIEISEDKKFKLMEQIKTISLPKDAVLIAIDGIRLEFEHGWGLIRASNTSPCLVSRFEAQTEKELLRIQSLFKELLWSLDKTLKIPF
jgi:phosphomannomutase/phosphomannomutase/phosphoglucomutase